MRKNDNFIFGIRPVIESIRAGKEFDKVFIQNGLKSDQASELFTLLKDNQIHFQYVPLEKLNRITRKNHQGVVAFTSLVSYQPIDEVVQMAFERGEAPLLIILDRVTDVRNFGAIARTAECAGVHGIIVPAQNSAQINADAMKTSAGALNFISISKVGDLSKTIDNLKKSGLQIVATYEKASETYTNIDLTIPTAIIIGSEEDGIAPALLKKADREVKFQS